MSKEVVEVENRTPQSSLRNLYYVLFRHKWKMILFFLTIMVIVVVGTLYSPEIYRSEAKLLVRLGRESVTLDPTATTGKIINVSRSRESEVNLELEILKSRELAEKVVDYIGPEAFSKRTGRKLSVKSVVHKVLRKTTQQVSTEVKEPQSLLEQLTLVERSDNRDAAVLGVMKNLEIKALKDSCVISITYETQSPKLAKDVITKLIVLYLEKHIAVHQAPGSQEFFTRQSEHLRGSLTQLEDELRDLKNATGISSVEEQRRVVLDRISILEKEIDTTEAELASSMTKVQTLEKTLATMPETVVTGTTEGFPNNAADDMRARLYELQLREQELTSKFNEENRQVQDVRRQIAAAQALLDKEAPTRTQMTKGLNSIHQQVQSTLFTEQATLSSLQAKIQILRRQLTTARVGLKTLNDAEPKITRLKREINMQEASYNKYSENLEQTRIDYALENDKISNISVVQPATLPTKPVPQRKLLNMALGLLVGIFGAIGLAFFLEYIDHSIRTPEELEEKLLLSTLAFIPRVRANKIRPTGKRRKQTKPSDKSVKSVPKRWKIPIKIREHYSVFREELLLKSNGHSKAPYVLAIIGCCRGEGVSTIAANISAMLAQLGEGRVLLVDANIRCPSAHRIFQTRLGPGLANILTADQDYRDIIASWRFQNLHILTAGIANGSSSGILRPAQFTKLINSMKKDYRYVVFDMPAVREARSAARLASLCDGVVLVVEAERLRWEVLLNAKAQLLKWNANVLGVVLNKRRFPIPEWLYQTL